MYLLAWEKLYSAGKIKRKSAIRVLKMWSFLSCLAEADVTLGVADHIRKRFDVAPLEMEDPMRLIHAPPRHVQLQRLQQFQASGTRLARTRQLKQLENYRLHDNGSGASVLMICNQGDNMWAVNNDVYSTRLQVCLHTSSAERERKRLCVVSGGGVGGVDCHCIGSQIQR